MPQMNMVQAINDALRQEMRRNERVVLLGEDIGKVGGVFRVTQQLFDEFGEDRVIFGSDYPNSYGVASIPETVALVRRFFSTKPRAAAEKYFWKNSARVYKWVKQSADQPTLA